MYDLRRARMGWIETAMSVPCFRVHDARNAHPPSSSLQTLNLTPLSSPAQSRIASTKSAKES